MDTNEVNDVLSRMLPPLKHADEDLDVVVGLSNSGPDWDGQALGEVGSTVDNIQVKLDNIKRTLNITQEPEQEPVDPKQPR